MSTESCLTNKEIVNIYINAFKHYKDKVIVKHEFNDGQRITTLSLFDLKIKKESTCYSLYYQDEHIVHRSKLIAEELEDLFIEFIMQETRKKKEKKEEMIKLLKRKFGNFL